MEPKLMTNRKLLVVFKQRAHMQVLEKFALFPKIVALVLVCCLPLISCSSEVINLNNVNCKNCTVHKNSSSSFATATFRFFDLVEQVFPFIGGEKEESGLFRSGAQPEVSVRNEDNTFFDPIDTQFVDIGTEEFLIRNKRDIAPTESTKNDELGEDSSLSPAFARGDIPERPEHWKPDTLGMDPLDYLLNESFTMTPRPWNDDLKMKMSEMPLFDSDEAITLDPDANWRFQNDDYVVPAVTMPGSDSDEAKPNSKWREVVYDLVKQRYHGEKDPGVEIIEPETLSSVENTGDGEDDEIPQARIEKFTKLRDLIRKKWKLRQRFKFKADFFEQKLAEDDEVSELATDLSKEELEMLWIFAFQTEQTDFAKYEKFYRTLLIKKKRGWRREVYKLVKFRYEGTPNANYSVIPPKTFSSEETDEDNMKHIETNSNKRNRETKYVSLRRKFRQKWKIGKMRKFNVKTFQDKMKLDAEAYYQLLHWPPEDIELLWVWMYQDAIEDFPKFEAFYWKILKMKNQGWRKQIYRMVKDRQADIRNPQVEVVYLERFSSEEDEDEEVEEIRPKVNHDRVNKYTKMRLKLRMLWDVRGHNKLNATTFLAKIKQENREPFNKMSEDELELLWVWTSQSVIEDFVKFEHFYWSLLRYTKPGWRKKVHEIAEGMFVGNPRVKVVAPDSFDSDEEDAGGIEEEHSRTHKFLKVRRLLRSHFAETKPATIEDLKHLEQDPFIVKLIKGWSEKDKEVLKVWVFQDVIENFPKFEHFYWQIIKRRNPGWKKRVFELAQAAFAVSEDCYEDVVYPASYDSGESLPDTEKSAKQKEREKEYFNIRRKLRKMWKEETKGTFSLQKYREKYINDKRAHEVVKDLPSDDDDMLWIWVHQNENHDFGTFEKFYREIVKDRDTKPGWRKKIHQLSEKRNKEESRTDWMLADFDDAPTSEEIADDINEVPSEEEKAQANKTAKFRMTMRALLDSKDNDLGSIEECKTKVIDNQDEFGEMSNDDMEKMCMWACQDYTKNYKKFDTLYDQIWLKKNPDWRKHVYKLAKAKFGDEDHSTTYNYVDEPTSFASEEGSHGLPEGEKLNELKKRAKLYSKIRRQIRNMLKIKKDADFDNEKCRKTFAENEKAREMVKDVPEEEYDKLCLWIQQGETDYYKKFEPFYNEIVKNRDIRPDWKKNLHELVKANHKPEDRPHIKVVDSADIPTSAELEEDTEVPGQEEQARAKKLQEVREKIRKQLGDDKGSNLNIDDIKTKLEEVLKYADVDPDEKEKLAMWVKQDNTRNFTKFDRLYEKIVQRRHPEWRKEIYDLAKERFPDPEKSYAKVVKPASFNSAENAGKPQEERSPEQKQRDKEFSSIYTKLRNRWNIAKESDGKFDANKYRDKLANDSKAQEMLKDFPEQDKDKLWIWLHQSSVHDYGKYEPFYDEIVKERDSKTDWRKNLFELVKARHGEMERPDLLLVNAEDIPTSEEVLVDDVGDNAVDLVVALAAKMIISRTKIRKELGIVEGSDGNINDIKEKLQEDPDIAKLPPEEQEKIAMFIKQDFTKNFLKYNRFYNRVLLKKHPDWRKHVHELAKQRFSKPEDSYAEVVTPSAFTSEEAQSAGKPVEERTDKQKKHDKLLSSIRAHLRNRWKLAKGGEKFDVNKYRQKLANDPTAQELIKDIPEEERDKLWIWVHQSSIHEHGKFEPFYNEIVKEKDVKKEWRKNIHQLVKARDSEVGKSNQAVVDQDDMATSEEVNDKIAKESPEVAAARAAKMTDLRNKIRKDAGVVEGSALNVDDIKNKLKEDPEMAKLSNEDLEKLAMWTKQDYTKNFTKFDNFYDKIVVTKEPDWRKRVYELAKQGFDDPEDHYADVVRPTSFTSGEVQTPERTAEHKIGDKKLESIREKLRSRWKLDDQKQGDKFDINKYREKLANDPEAQELTKDIPDEELDKLFLWTHQNSINDYGKFEPFYDQIVKERDTKRAWRKHIHQLIKTRNGELGRPDLSVVDSEDIPTSAEVEEDIENDSSDGAKSFLKHAQMAALRKKIRKELRIFHGSNGNIDDIKNKLKEDPETAKLSPEEQEKLAMFVKQDNTKNYRKFAKFYSRVVEKKDPNWRKTIHDLANKRYADKDNLYTEVVDPSSFVSGEASSTPKKEPSEDAKKRSKMFTKIRRTLQRSWKIGEDGGDFDANKYREKLAKDPKAQELIKDVPENERDKLWIWVHQKAIDNFDKFEPFYDEIVKEREHKKDWRKKIYQLVEARHEENPNPDLRLADEDSLPTSEEINEMPDDDDDQDRSRRFAELRDKLRKALGALEGSNLKIDDILNKLSEEPDYNDMSDEEKEKIAMWIKQDYTRNYPKFEKLYNKILVKPPRPMQAGRTFAVSIEATVGPDEEGDEFDGEPETLKATHRPEVNDWANVDPHAMDVTVKPFEERTLDPNLHKGDAVVGSMDDFFDNLHNMMSSARAPEPTTAQKTTTTIDTSPTQAPAVEPPTQAPAKEPPTQAPAKEPPNQAPAKVAPKQAPAIGPNTPSKLHKGDELVGSMDDFFDNLHKQMASARTPEPDPTTTEKITTTPKTTKKTTTTPTTTTTEIPTTTEEVGKSKLSIQGRTFDAPPPDEETTTEMATTTEEPGKSKLSIQGRTFDAPPPDEETTTEMPTTTEEPGKSKLSIQGRTFDAPPPDEETTTEMPTTTEEPGKSKLSIQGRTFDAPPETTTTEEPGKSENSKQARSFDAPTTTEEPGKSENSKQARSFDAPTTTEEPGKSENSKQARSFEAPTTTEMPTTTEEPGRSKLSIQGRTFDAPPPDEETTTEMPTTTEEPGKSKLSIQGRTFDAPPETTTELPTTTMPTTKKIKPKMHKGDEVVGSMDEYFDNLHKMMSSARTPDPTTTTEIPTPTEQPGKSKLSNQGRTFDAPPPDKATTREIPTTTEEPGKSKLSGQGRTFDAPPETTTHLPTTKSPKIPKLHKGDEVVGSS